jgi:hypothetical protein
MCEVRLLRVGCRFLVNTSLGEKTWVLAAFAAQTDELTAIDESPRGATPRSRVGRRAGSACPGRRLTALLAGNRR